MEFVGTQALLLVSGAMIVAVAWVSWVQHESAGLWWAAAGGAVAIDGWFSMTQSPAWAAVYCPYVTGPAAAWFLYRGARAYSGKLSGDAPANTSNQAPHGPSSPSLAPGDRLAKLLPLVVAISLLLLSSGFAELAFAINLSTSILFLALAGHSVLRSAGGPVGRLLGLALGAATLALALGLLTVREYDSRQPHVAAWLASFVPLGVLEICALFERSVIRTQHAIDRNTQQLRLAALSSSPIATWSYDPADKQMTWSDQIFEFHGFDPGAGPPGPIASLDRVIPEDRERLRAAARKALAEGHELNLDVGLRQATGAVAYVSFRGKRMTTPEGGPILVGSLVDVTEKRRTIEELERYRDQLEDLVRKRTEELDRSNRRLQHSQRLASLGTLSAGLAHQVNNPVGGILAAANFAQSYEGERDELTVLRNAIRDIESEATRCGEIVRGMLQFASDRPSDKKILPIDAVLTPLRDVMQRRASERGVTLNIETPGASPFAEIAKLEIEQVLSNLIENAFEACEAGAFVRVRRSCRDRQIVIEVIDDGPGIPPEFVPFVRDPFYTSRLSEGGTGLGLSIAHGIALAHGGDLTIENNVGHGTTARLSLPLAHL